MSFIHGFPPIANANATVLILGSMPGKASLRAQQYYAHPRNAFWPLMETLAGAEPGRDYPGRCRLLLDGRIALWDVLQTCTRESSLDSDILEASIVTNDFAAFFAAHPDIGQVFFNGAKAESVYRRQVLPTLKRRPASLPLIRLPSTSPAHAAMNFDEKLAQWRRVIK